jgi:Predicted nucleotide-binding protein containing TIR-like domain
MTARTRKPYLVRPLVESQQAMSSWISDGESLLGKYQVSHDYGIDDFWAWLSHTQKFLQWLFSTDEVAEEFVRICSRRAKYSAYDTRFGVIPWKGATAEVRAGVAHLKSLAVNLPMMVATGETVDIGDKTRHSESISSDSERVFIGHGRSPLWRELKDYVQDRLALPWDEFNRLPIAGVTNIERLQQMLDHARMALLVLTAEDERIDGRVSARQNVIHEAGLFQGRLGFRRALVLIEEGCDEFSNISGLGQIRFPSARISATFEEVRRCLEREGFIR